MAIREHEAQESSGDSSCTEVLSRTLDEGLARPPSPPAPPCGGDSVAPAVVETIAVGGLAAETLARSPDPLDYLLCDELDCYRADEDEFPADGVGDGLSVSDLADFEKPSSDSSLSVQKTEDFMVGAGLANLGNTCFLNAVMQCFTHTVPLVQGLRSCSHPRPCERAFEDFCVLCTLRDHIQNSLSSAGGVISPVQFFNNLNHFSSSFMKYAQEDAHEFLQCFLDKLERSLLDPTTVSPPGPNLVERVFGARLVSKLECCNCGHSSETFEPLTDLSLEIEGMDNLPTALRSFTKVEKIEDSETKFQCQNCKEDVVMAKQLMMDKAPSVAVFHLKRFKADGLGVQKIDKHVEFPLELDLQPYTVCASGDDMGLKYDLYGVVVHNGYSSSSGHYYSFIRSSPHTWHSLDDFLVTRVSEEHVLAQGAYILFYAKRGTSWFSSLMGPNMPLKPEARTSSPKSVLDTVDDASPVAVDDDALAASGASGCLKKVECSNVTICTVTPLAESDSHMEVEGVNTDGVFHPLTPPRPQTPDVASLESPGSDYQIPRKHLKSEERAYRKRVMNKSPEDSEKKEAMRYLSRSMPSSRGSKLMEALFRPQSEEATKKRKLKPCNRSSPANDHHKSSHASVTHPVAVLR